MINKNILDLTLNLEEVKHQVEFRRREIQDLNSEMSVIQSKATENQSFSKNNQDS